MTFFNFTAKHYSVTPLGAHSGLISWVDGMTPIFALYKKWQQRQASSPKKEKSPNATTTTTKNTPPQAIARPSELYFQKLTPLLNKHNIKATQSSRKEWPLEALKEVLAELTGSHLILICSHFLSSLELLNVIMYSDFTTHTHSRDTTRSSFERTLVCISFCALFFYSFPNERYF